VIRRILSSLSSGVGKAEIMEERRSNIKRIRRE
jgi:hypothetical protein